MVSVIENEINFPVYSIADAIGFHSLYQTREDIVGIISLGKQWFGFIVIHFAMFAKYWEPGQVKTRLGRVIGNPLASDIHLMFVQHLVNRFGAFGDRRTLVYSPATAKNSFRQFLPDTWDMQPQSDGNLGIRMKTFFRESTDVANCKTLLIGSDTPDIPVSFAHQVVQMLDEVQVVLGPSSDGGYYLIAMNGFCDVFDDVPWSTDQVLASTLNRLDQQRIPFQLLPELTDVDEIDDLKRLMQKLKSADRDLLDENLYGQLMQLDLSHD